MNEPALDNFWTYLWKVTKYPWKKFRSDPLLQSAAAAGINIWFLVIAVLGQFWVVLSALLLIAQAYNCWLISRNELNKILALLVGIVIVFINISALSLAVLAQFWVFGSTALALWQFVCLLKLCLRKDI